MSSRIRFGLVCSLAVLCSLPLIRAQEVMVTRITPSGHLTWEGENIPTNYIFTLEWASRPHGPWHTTFDSLNDLVLTNTSMRVEIPMFYRVVGYPRDTFQREHTVYYTFEEITNGVLPDQSRYGFDGDVYGATVVTNGFVGNCYRFDGTNDYVDFGTNLLEEVPFSISFWYKTEKDKYAHSLIGNYIRSSFSGKGFILNHYGTSGSWASRKLVLFLGAGGTGLNDGAQVPLDDQWHHIAMVFKKSGTWLFRDGAHYAHSDDVYNPTEVHFRIGDAIEVAGGPGIEAAFAGMMDNLHIYTRVLHAEEILEMYERERPQD